MAERRAHQRGVILDVDGTLIDSNDAHAQAWVEAGRELGYEIAFDEVRRLIGMGGDRVMPMVAGVEEDSPEGERLSERRSDIFRRRHLPGLEPLPRVRELLQRLRDDGFELVVASSSNPTDLGALLERAGVADLIGPATSAGDAEESKPAPDILEAAISRARPGRDGLLMVGDTPYDVESARRARVPIVAVRSGGWDDDELQDQHVLGVYEHTGDLLDHYEEVFLRDWS
jgi:phosphoglycolate phosphatase-like HAD superfamily hydrolase